VELQGRVDELRQQGIGLAAISYDGPEVLARFSAQYGIAFPLLSDEGSATIRRFGILNPVAEWAQGPNSDDPAVQADIRTYVSEVNANPGMIGMAFPGTFMLDPDGRVTSRFFEDFYVQRNTVAGIMMRLGAALEPVAATKVTTPQLDLTTYPSDAAIAPGDRFSLVIDIEPHEGMHVYAPGATNYRVIRLDLDPLPYLETLSMEYPDSEIYYFEPLDERVPVYQEPFQLVQEVVFWGSREAQATLRGMEEVTFTGTLEYQACDDTLCYQPQSIPLSWRMDLRPLVRSR
jgi:peroxiredoxin